MKRTLRTLRKALRGAKCWKLNDEGDMKGICTVDIKEK
jgi:hypothetical protein